ncbi:cytochrome P450 [Nakamurella sp.]|uniref:cytochrome P450 n=1 Tax=Nakamurella sp. TaxID=1869182 RepID=UPI00378410ED
MTEALPIPLLLSRDGLDPIAELRERRAAEPVSKLELPFGIVAWLVSGYEQAKQVLGDATTFSNDIGNLTSESSEDPGGLGMTDPPYHTKLRRLLTPEFTMRKLQRLRPRIAEIVDGQLDAIEAAGRPADLVEHFAMPIPSLVICELLGVPYGDREEFQALSTARFEMGDESPLDVIGTSLEYLGTLVARERAKPGDGLLGQLITEHGDELTDRELAGLADGILTGGHETTAASLSLGALALLQSPDSFAALGSADEQTVHLAVEELLRYLSVVQVAFPRFTRAAVRIGDVDIPAGQMVFVSLSGADRDPALGPDLERFDPTRPATSHLGFGYGIHRCVGAELARIELRIAFPALARRFPTLRPAVSMAELDFRQTSIVYSAVKMPVVW